MATLKHITFTGIDEHTDIKMLCAIQKKFPFVEWGVLASYNWKENGFRYPNPKFLDWLRDKGLNLSLHCCGKVAHHGALGMWSNINKNLLNGNLDLFQRAQLNVVNREDNPLYVSYSIEPLNEVIIQQRSAEDMDLYKTTMRTMRMTPDKYHNFSVLLDASGGRGIDTPINIPIGLEDAKIGFAGGINPGNVREKLLYILNQPNVGDFWIDMESGVRTDDWFDIGKVLDVLRNCAEVLATETPKNNFVYPDKLYARCKDNKTLDISYAPQNMEAVEYTRTDAFIEKACEFIKERLFFEDSWHIEGEVSISDKVFEDFKNYLKNEENNL